MLITKPYSVKLLANGASRVYISSPDIIKASGFKEGQYLTATYKNGLITVQAASDRSSSRFKLLNTSRGLILEMRTMGVTKSLRGIGRALVKATKGVVKILPHPTELKRLEREQRFIKRLLTKKPLDRGSLYSGIGNLSAYTADGLMQAGIKSRIRFANDICPVALAVNTQHNSMWLNAHPSAEAVCSDIRELLAVTNIPTLDMLDISYPCNGQSTMISPDQRDLMHAAVGDLFIDTVAAIKASNCAMMIMECTPAFLKSDTIRLTKQALSDYIWHDFKLSGADHGEIENRPRVAVLGISKGLSHLFPINPGQTIPSKERPTPTLSEFLDDVDKDSDLWGSYSHVLKKVDDDRLDFKLAAHNPTDTRIATIMATYASPKIGSPFVKHPTNSKLMRMFSVNEHANIKRVEPSIKQALLDIESGNTELTSKRGSKGLAHKLLGMGVNRYPWTDFGFYIGLNLLQNLVPNSLF